MGIDFKDLKKKAEKIGDKIPDDAVEKAKKLATKENIEKVKDKAEDIIHKFKK